MPDRNWIREQSERVRASYAKYISGYRADVAPSLFESPPPPHSCDKPTWLDGPPCELPLGHPDEIPHSAPSVTKQPGKLFEGPIPSSRPKHPPYTVTVYDTAQRTAECTCEGFTKYNRGRDCSHIQTVKEALRNAGR